MIGQGSIEIVTLPRPGGATAEAPPKKRSRCTVKSAASLHDDELVTAILDYKKIERADHLLFIGLIKKRYEAVLASEGAGNGIDKLSVATFAALTKVQKDRMKVESDGVRAKHLISIANMVAPMKAVDELVQSLDHMKQARDQQISLFVLYEECKREVQADINALKVLKDQKTVETKSKFYFDRNKINAVANQLAAGRYGKDIAHSIGEDIHKVCACKNRQDAKEIGEGLVLRTTLATDGANIKIEVPGVYVDGPLHVSIFAKMETDSADQRKDILSRCMLGLAAKPKWPGSFLQYDKVAIQEVLTAVTGATTMYADSVAAQPHVSLREWDCQTIWPQRVARTPGMS